MKLGAMNRGISYANLAILKTAMSAAPDALGGKALRREFARRLVGMRGVPMKMAQILSMSQDSTMAILQSEAIAEVPSAPAAEILERLQALDPALRSSIEECSERGISASLGQVHRIRLHDGRICALKMKHRDIGISMDLDAELMAFLVSVFGAFREGFDIESFRSVLTDELKGELDYPFEMSRQAQFWKEFGDNPGIVVPKPYPRECGPDHLVMDWEPSVPIAEFAAGATDSERYQGLALLEEFHMRSLFSLGMAHADPNPGNFGFRRGSVGIELVVYDYGSAIPLGKTLHTGLAALITAVSEGSDPLPILIGMDFHRQPLQAIADRIPDLCRILLEPFTAAKGFRIADWDRRRRVAELLGAERWNLMVAAPPHAFFLIRAMHGLFHYGGILGGVLNLRRWLPEKVGQEEGAPKPKDIPDASKGISIGTRAESLRVKLTKNNFDVVSVTMPLNAVDRLEEIMDPELLLSLRAEGIDVKNASESARRNGYKAMELFAWNGGNKTVRIWLE